MYNITYNIEQQQIQYYERFLVGFLIYVFK